MNTNIRTPLFRAAQIIALSALTFGAHAAQCNFTQINGTLIDFGIISAANSSDVIAINNIEFTCSDPVLPTIGYDVAISSGSSGNFANRTMLDGGATVDYNLYRDPSNILIFGDGQPGTNSGTVGGICVNGQTCIVPVYGRIIGGQAHTSGQYTDTVVVTVTF